MPLEAGSGWYGSPFSEERIGVMKEGPKFEAHAWVENQGNVIIGKFEQNRYLPIMVWD